MLTDTEHELMQLSIEQLRLAGLSAFLIAEKYTNERLEKIAGSIIKLHGALETEYAAVLVAAETCPPASRGGDE